MDDDLHHSWDLAPEEARALQNRLRSLVRLEDDFGRVRLVGGTDVGFEDGGATTRAAVVVLSFPELTLIEHAISRRATTFPYVPGLLSFREAPAVLDAFEKLRTRPDVVICDGQGIAHPRRLGIASHLGLWLGLPTVGCAKSLLCGRYDEPGPARGDRSALVDRGEVIGMAVRSRARVKPLFVSPGHLCDHEGAVALVLAATNKYRLPLPSRMAHQFVNEMRRQADPGGPIPG